MALVHVQATRTESPGQGIAFASEGRERVELASNGFGDASSHAAPHTDQPINQRQHGSMTCLLISSLTRHERPVLKRRRDIPGLVDRTSVCCRSLRRHLCVGWAVLRAVFPPGNGQAKAASRGCGSPRNGPLSGPSRIRVSFTYPFFLDCSGNRAARRVCWLASFSAAITSGSGRTPRLEREGKVGTKHCWTGLRLRQTTPCLGQNKA